MTYVDYVLATEKKEFNDPEFIHAVTAVLDSFVQSWTE
jgi:hypothetical protein